MEITRDERVVVRAPMHTPQSVIEAFVAERSAWISAHLQRRREDNLAHPPLTADQVAELRRRQLLRGFLLRLGFIGADSKEQRKLLLKNLSGSAAFPNKEKADAFSAAQKAKRDAAKAAAENTSEEVEA